MNNKKEKRITTSFLKAMKLMITSFMMYAFPSMMLNIISTIAGHAIPIKDCYNYVAVAEFAIGILAAGLYAIFSPGYLSRTTVIQSLFLAGEISGLGHFWYIRLIIICYLFTPVLYYLTKLLNKVKFKFPMILLLREGLLRLPLILIRRTMTLI